MYIYIYTHTYVQVYMFYLFHSDFLIYNKNNLSSIACIGKLGK